MTRFKSIITQLLLAFAAIIILTVFSNSFVYFVTDKMDDNFARLSSTSIPLVKANFNLRNNILESTSALERQIITGADSEDRQRSIAKRNGAWQMIEQQFTELRELAIDTGYAGEQLQQVQQLLAQLKNKQQQISDVANTEDNEPALKILTRQAIPLASSTVELLSSIIELEFEEELDEERQELLALLVQSRATFSSAISEMRAFLLTRDEVNVDGFDQAWLANTDAFVEILEDYEELLTDEQLEMWESYGSERERIAPLTIRAFQMQASPEANYATYHLATAVEPISKQIFDILGTLDSHVMAVSDSGIKRTSDSVGTIVFTLMAATLITIIMASTISYMFSNNLRKRIAVLLSRAKVIATGDFSRQSGHSEQSSADELGQLSHNFDDMSLSLSKTISSIKQQSRQVGHSAHQVALIASEISDVAKSESDSYSEVMRVTESFMDLLLESSNAVEESKSILEQANTQANSGLEAVDSNIQEMNRTVDVVTKASAEVAELKEASEKIDQVTAAISTVADQTALIALNAAIEAARAGEQGRGFAVVADEVRSLAQRTANSTDEIREVIGQLIGKVSDVIALMDNIIQQVTISKERSDESGQALHAMTSSVSQIIQSNDNISQRSSQQNSQMLEMQYKLQHLFHSLQENSEKAQIVSLIGGDLYQTSELVNQLMDQFTFSRDSQADASDQDDSRRSKRLEAKIRLQVEQDGELYTTVSRNYSLVGVGIILSEALNQALAIDSDVVIKILGPQTNFSDYVDQQPICIKGKVVRSITQEDFVHTYYGIEFAFESDEETAAIAALYEFFEQ